MNTGLERAHRASRSTGIVSVLAGLALGAALPVELLAGMRDTDNAAESLTWLESNTANADIAAALLLVGGALLVVAALGLRMQLARGGIGLALESATAFGVIGGVLYVMAGAIRSNAQAIQYIETFDRGWAESAYLATHLIGNQSLLPLAELGASGWLVAVAIAGVRRRLPGLLAVGVLPALTLVFILLAKVVPGVLEADGAGIGWTLHIVNLLVAVPLGIVVVGVTLLIPRRVARLSREMVRT